MSHSSFIPAQRYPDPAIEILDPSFLKYRIFSSAVEQLGVGMRWAEGPVYFPDRKCLLLSDIPNNRIMKYDEATESFGVYESNSHYSNGLAKDQQGRLLICEHLSRAVSRIEYDGSRTILASHYQGKRLNSPNDIVCSRDGAIWFTDPSFGIAGEWEGTKAPQELPHSVYRIAPDGTLHLLVDDLKGPNGLAFSPDETQLYIVESRAEPSRLIWRYDVSATGMLSNKTKIVDANGPGALDGFAVDVDGNLWCGFGATATGDPAELDGVMVYNPQGKAIGFIRLPERCANLTFGGIKKNRLYMASSRALYGLYVETQGA
jgi:gluconolactonase